MIRQTPCNSDANLGGRSNFARYVRYHRYFPVQRQITDAILGLHWLHRMTRIRFVQESFRRFMPGTNTRSLKCSCSSQQTNRQRHPFLRLAYDRLQRSGQVNQTGSQGPLQPRNSRQYSRLGHCLVHDVERISCSSIPVLIYSGQAISIVISRSAYESSVNRIMLLEATLHIGQ